MPAGRAAEVRDLEVPVKTIGRYTPTKARLQFASFPLLAKYTGNAAFPIVESNATARPHARHSFQPILCSLRASESAVFIFLPCPNSSVSSSREFGAACRASTQIAARLFHRTKLAIQNANFGPILLQGTSIQEYQRRRRKQSYEQRG